MTSVQPGGAVMRPLDAALQLAGQGIANFPCNNEKRPTCPHGYKDATADLQQLRALCRDCPGDLIGVPTGEINGFDVLDLDFARHKEAVDWWGANKSGIPMTRIHRTRSGGIHCLFCHDDGARSVNGWLETGVDVKANGGYIINWPSHGLPIVCDAPISSWPRWLIRAMQPPPALAFRPILANGSVEPLVKFVSSLHDGQRNCGTHWAACRVWERDGSDGDLQAIVQAAMQAGLPATEAKRVVFRQARKTVKGD
jgi:hypothetical protein